jgi:DNA adenine methylase
MSNRAFAPAPVSETASSAAPIVKWAGGKGQLLDRLLPQLPARMNRYFEPFAGGAALFFALAPRDAVLCDVNAELVNMYTVARDELTSLVRTLKPYRYDRERFYQVRATDPGTLTPVERAARFIYLNRTCFNGLYRVNRRGQFNVPFGRYTNPRICDVPRLSAASRVLAGARVRLADFEAGAAEAKRGDFVYFDPPYVPVSRTASFTSYTAGAFGMEAQERLADTVRMLDRRGCKVMLSNSDAPVVHELYKGFQIARVTATRNINSRAGSRGAIFEVVVRNY